MDDFNGMYVITGEIFVSDKLERVKKHKKKRIDKKWKKRHGWHFPPLENIIVMNNTIYAHPKTWDKLQAKIKRGERHGFWI